MTEYSVNIGSLIDFWNNEKLCKDEIAEKSNSVEKKNCFQSISLTIRSIGFNLQYLYNNGVCQDILDHYLGHWNYVLLFVDKSLNNDPLTTIQREYVELKREIVQTYISQLESIR